MFRKSVLIISLFLLASASVSQAAELAPFGLTWGATANQIKAAGIKLDPIEDDFYQTPNVPANTDLAKTYVLYIDKKLGLVRIAAYTDDITDDQSGQKGKRTYYRLKGELERTFVQVRSEENDSTTPGIVMPKDMSFYTCLDTGGPCGPWFSSFVSGDINAQVILEALDKDAGYVSVIYENNALVRKLEK